MQGVKSFVDGLKSTLSFNGNATSHEAPNPPEEAYLESFSNVFSGLMLSNILSTLTLREIITLSATCRHVRAQLKLPEPWDQLLATRYSSLPQIITTTDDEHPRVTYMQLAMSQRVSTASKDVSIAGLPAEGDLEEDWWALEQGGDFGRHAVLRTICWGEWFAWRWLPAHEEYDVVIKMKWTSRDFERTERPTMYQVTLFPPDLDPSQQKGSKDMAAARFNRIKHILDKDPVPEGCERLKEYSVSDADRSRLGSTLHRWVYLNMGAVRVPRDGLVAVRYWGCCPYWFGGWAIDWIGFMPVGMIKPGVSLVKELQGPK
mmetsp:Transcript_7939/g.17036  ORF Transcript_7939/g.17036 Transcript_7939/m.17036 type:complete len:317 (+) Transcript_7939:133-1083(+)|eukprot:CAMPEP_0202895074 /NCGR_PEP_ID=MMETSP1392-20130828/4350_1 /ASSEMBLY_ACC=CAM_ASM_000868 /TAXON_ID=225041 /ORGANISM="Chlamydomonas chlamydogama, Strain SAG 11-48b" /LENGTH=316 /DNA_ID=CAMNT_0049579965 /DNA_START=126 /DNA_END=1076 /DNA_ORIENTATION=-